MFDFYRIGNEICFAREGRAVPEALKEAGPEAARKADRLTFLYFREPGSCRASFLVNDLLLLFQERESAAWLSSEELKKAAAADAEILDSPENAEEKAMLIGFMEKGKLRAVNACQSGWEEILKEGSEGASGPAFLPSGKKRVNILAIGDVGSNLLTGLHLLGGDCISGIGICDLDEKVTARWAFEQNQIAYPWDYDRLPEVRAISTNQLFDADVVVFVASKGIPPVGSGVKDVRMYQFENNRKIVGMYARQARKCGFRGLFCQVSDPVDPLAKTAFLESNRNEEGELDWKGLRPEQVQGFGLGVMNARAAYYAKRDPRFKRFLTEGRSFGPHGQELVVADSILNYDDELSRELTEKVVTANLEMRALGFKPFVAPAFSSGALSILLLLRGEWHCGSVYLGGAFMGVKNRYTPDGLETEVLPLPDKLFSRIREAEETLKSIC